MGEKSNQWNKGWPITDIFLAKEIQYIIFFSTLMSRVMIVLKTL